jgi:DNA-directed RNA polymerase subunit RPC12/RpoP
MAKILKCSRCQSSMDVTSVSPGSTVRCPDCGQMARVPTGATSLAVKTVSAPIPAPAPAPAPPAARERGTRVRERSRSSGTNPTIPPEQHHNNGLIIGLSIGLVAVVVVVVMFTMKGQEEAPPARPSPPKETGTVVFQPKLPPSSDKPIVLGSGASSKDEPKPTQISKPADNADNANWDSLIRELRSGGGFDHPDRPEGQAFARVKGFGKAAYPKLIAYIDHEQPEFGIAAVAVLNALTGRDSALPKGVTKAKIKAEWEEWLKTAGDAKPEAPKDAPK